MESKKEIGQYIEDSIIEANALSGGNSIAFMNHDKVQTLIGAFEEIAIKKGLDVIDFFHVLGMGVCNNGFLQKNEGSHTRDFFETLEIPIPPLINRLVKEVEIRSNYIENVFKEEKYNWNKDKKEDYLIELKNEVESRSFEKSHRINYLSSLHQLEVENILLREKECKKFYNLKQFYKGEVFIGDSEDLNWFFCSGLLQFRFDELFLKINSLFESKNKINLIQEYKLQIENESIAKVKGRDLRPKQRSAILTIIKEMKNGLNITNATKKAAEKHKYNIRSLDTIKKNIKEGYYHCEEFTEILRHSK